MRKQVRLILFGLAAIALTALVTSEQFRSESQRNEITKEQPVLTAYSQVNTVTCIDHVLSTPDPLIQVVMPLADKIIKSQTFVEKPTVSFGNWRQRCDLAINDLPKLPGLPTINFHIAPGYEPNLGLSRLRI